MIEGKTQSGFAFKLDENKLDDMEVLEYINSVTDDMSELPKLVEILLGKTQKKKLYDFVRKMDGKVSISTTYEIIMEIFAIAGEDNEEVKKD